MATKDQSPHPEPQPSSPVEVSTSQTGFPSASSGLGLTGFAEEEQAAGGERQARRGRAAGKPIPTPTPETEPYWEGCRRHQLRIQRCSNCHYYQFFPRIYCSKCFSEQVEWVNASGHAKVLSFTIVRRPVSPAFADEIPYIVALVTLEEGPQMMTNIVECAPEEVTIGLAVEVIFEDWSDRISLPQFRPRRS
jgi:uncharacterized protein